MASETIIAAKAQAVADLTEVLKGALTGVLVDYSGITVEDDTKLRRQLREAGVRYTVVKNTLLLRAANEVGLGDLEGVLSGSTALATCDSDYIAAARILCKYAETNDKFTVKAGFLDGKVLTAAEVQNLASTPSKEGLLSMLCSALTGNLRGLAVAINAIVEKNEQESA